MEIGGINFFIIVLIVLRDPRIGVALPGSIAKSKIWKARQIIEFQKKKKRNVLNSFSRFFLRYLIPFPNFWMYRRALTSYESYIDLHYIKRKWQSLLMDFG
jgi:hypothetical protein